MRALADLLHSYFEDAAQEAGLESRAVSLAGRDIEFRFAGNRWAHLMRAFSHLEPPAGNPRLTVHVWDGKRLPRHHVLRAYLYTLTNWWFDYVGPRGHLLDVHSPGLDAVYIPGPDLLHVVDTERSVAYCWKREPSDLPYWETCSPFRPLLHCWFRAQRRQFVHAAAVGRDDGGVLMVGRGGSGKSSSALACLDSPLRYLGDDYCIVSRDATGYTVHGLYSTAKLVGPEDLKRFPALAPHVWNPDREPDHKAAFFLHEQVPEKFIGRFPLRAILVPEIAGGADTHLVPCRPAEAMEALAPWTLSQLPASGAEDLRFLGELVRRIPCYRLQLGSDLARIPGVIAGVLDAKLAPVGEA